MREIIKVKNVSKVYKINKRKSGLFGAVLNLFAPRYEKKIAVSDMNFSIEEGEAVAFIGSNGAGKSTTIKMLSGILYPSEGEITVASYVPYKQRKKYVSNIGVVLGQKSQLVWDLPVRDGYELIRHIYKISKEDYEKRLDEFIEMLDMKEFINQPVRQLSLGQKMRAEIVATMLHNPKIIFLDEPTIGLDLVAKKKIQDFIRTINKKYNVTIIFTTHDMQDIVSTCERLIIIDKGKKIYDGAVKNVKELCDDVKILRVEMAQGEKVSNDGLLNIKECDENIVEIMFEKPKLQLERVSKYLNDNYLVKSIRPMSSEQDILEVVTKDSQMIVDTTIYESEKIHDNHFRIKLKDVNTQLGATLNKFVSIDNRQLKDLAKKILNINKYKTVMLNELSINMMENGYDTIYINRIKELADLLYAEWSDYVTVSVSKIKRKRFDSPEAVTESIEKMEDEIVSITKGYIDFLEKDEGTDRENKKISNEIIFVEEGKIIFSITDGKTHNFWFEDKAPKYPLLKNCNDDKIFAKARILFNQESEENLYQAGIYVKSAEDKVYYMAIDNDRNCILDTIGENNRKEEFDNTNEYLIKMNLEADCLKVQFISDASTKELKMMIERLAPVEVGLMVKTWGNGGFLEVDFKESQAIISNK